MAEKLPSQPSQPYAPKYEQQFRLYGIDASQQEKLDEFGITQKALDWADHKKQFEIAMGQRHERPEHDAIPKRRVVLVGATTPAPDLVTKEDITPTNIKDEQGEIVPALWVVEYWYDKKGRVRTDAIDIPIFRQNNGAWEASDFLNDEQLEIVNELVRDKWEAKYMEDIPEISIPDMDDTLTDVPRRETY